jgi:tRNA(Ile)-lysidine synthetase-like protein
MDVVLPKPGKYVVAVSGGVDSTALLDILTTQPNLDLVVAHFDHGIRPDSNEDRELVEKAAGIHRIPFVYQEGKLGVKTSEARAREARYKFLRGVLNEHGASAIITAHHQDDLIETAMLNMLRGTGRKGITSLKSRTDVLRPLLNVPKVELISYAKGRNLEWREDETNQDTNYLRNYVRHNVMPNFSDKDRQKFLVIISNLSDTNKELDASLVKYLSTNLDRQLLISAPHDVAREIMSEWLRQNGIRDFSRNNIEKLVIAAKTGGVGKKFPVLKGRHMIVNKHDLALEGLER